MFTCEQVVYQEFGKISWGGISGSQYSLEEMRTFFERIGAADIIYPGLAQCERRIWRPVAAKILADLSNMVRAK